MSAWREQGFVQDSDEEEDFYHGISQSKPASNIGKEGDTIIPEEVVCGTAGCIRQQSNYEVDELQLASPGFRPGSLASKPAAEVAGTVNNVVHDNITASTSDLASSPLSSPPSSIGNLSNSSLQLSNTFNDFENNNTTPKPVQQSVQVLVPQQHLPESEHNEDISEALAQFTSSRNFRRRKAIQLHPFLIEGEKYRTFMKARGLKPVNVPTVQSYSATRVPQQETQDGEFQGDFHDSIANLASSPVESSTSIGEDVLQSIEQENTIHEDEDDLPELGAVLDRPELLGALRKQDTHANSGRKRKKLENGKLPDVRFRKPRFRMISSSPVVAHTAKDSQHDNNGPVRDYARDEDFNTSHTAYSESGQVLPTPFTSSDRKASRDVEVVGLHSDDSSPNKPLKLRHHLLTPASLREVSVSDSSDSSSDSVQTVRDDIKNVRKRIKGVLPASWLRLDKQAQLKGSGTKKIHLSHDNSEDEGRADPDKKSEGMLENPDGLNQAIDISDESDAMSQTVAQVNVTGPYSSLWPTERRISPESLFKHGEAQEDDLIDPMRPTVSRKPYQKTAWKRQTRLTDAHGPPSKRVKTGCTVLGKNVGQRGTKSDHDKKQRKRARPHIQLSILDASDQMFEEYSKLPDFIKIARREARRLPNKGRHLPSAKTIKLQTMQDTTDARLTLHAWRAGRMKPLQEKLNSTIVVSDRPPLKEIAANGRQLKLWAVERDLNVDEASSRSRPRVASTPEDDMKIKFPLALQQGMRRNLHSFHTKQKTNQLARQKKTYGTSKLIRSAQLETLDNAANDYTRQMEFRREISRRNAEFTNALQGKATLSNDTGSVSIWQGNMAGNENMTGDERVSGVDMPSREGENKFVSTAAKKKRPPRKVVPSRLDVHAREYRQPEEPSPVFDNLASATDTSPAQRGDNVLKGLDGHGTIYTRDFDVLPLEPGTHFHLSTFIGSGELRKAMDIVTRNFDQPAQPVQLPGNTNGKRLVNHGPWNEEVGAEIDKTFRIVRLPYESSLDISDIARLNDVAQASSMLRSVITYVSTSLYFLDFIDRRSFLEKMIWLLLDINEVAGNFFDSMNMSAAGGRPPVQSQYVRPVTLISVLAGQMFLLAHHGIIGSSMKDQIQTAFKSIVTQTARANVLGDTDEVTRFLEDNKLHIKREEGLREEDGHVESLVILRNVLNKIQIPKLSFWDVINDELLSIYNSNNVKDLERAWKFTFTTLPLSKLDIFGTLHPQTIAEDSGGNWSMIKVLMTRVLDLYEESARGQISTLNSYVRACLTRCHVLLTHWDWVRCEPILGVVFDFFARNKLQNLRLEDPRGSPVFLRHFQKEQCLQVDVEDRAFHIFLKSLAMGIIELSKISPEKRMQGTVWRFIPNHGRVYRKDETVNKEEIDALRNHHDILTTIYLAAPHACRPRISLIRNLVYHRHSHSAACYISICSWAQLTTFQLSTDEPIERLDPLLSWYKEIVNQTISQYHSARAEVEGLDFGANEVIAKAILEKTVISNQKQVLRSLTEIISAMKNVVQTAPSEVSTGKLILDTGFMDIIQLYDIKSAQFDMVVYEALDVLLWFPKSCRRASLNSAARTGDDSQNYGDWPDLDDTCMDDALEKSDQISQIQSVHCVLQQLLSNSAGMDRRPDDTLLQKIIRCWVEVASCAVLKREKDWPSYLDVHAQESWHRLRNTEHSRKLYPFFMATVLDYIGNGYGECSHFFINALLLSLVERESLFKYQHLLLSRLLNMDPSHALLCNSPFCVDGATGKFKIDLATVKERRLQLLSNVLSNLRADSQRSSQSDPNIVQRKRVEYRSLLKQLMDKMKTHYLELQEFSTRQGAYIDFVHHMVDLLQQHTTDICPIDKFFTTSNTFPLPAKDPAYVVARLKSYSHKLSQMRSLKQLAVFVQAASEQAAIDNHQKQLEDQLYEALSFEPEGKDGSGLRQILLLAVFPAYIELSLTMTTCWVMSMPILQAAKRMLDDMLFKFSSSDRESVDAVGQLLSSFLSVTCRNLKRAGFLADLMDISAFFSTLGALVECVSSAVISLEYVHRCDALIAEALSDLAYLQTFAHLVKESGPAGLDVRFYPVDEAYTDASSLAFLEIRQYCKRELEDSLFRYWTSTASGQYVFSRGMTKKTIQMTDVGLTESRSRLVVALDGLDERLARSKLFEDKDLGIMAARREEGVNNAFDVMV